MGSIVISAGQPIRILSRELNLFSFVMLPIMFVTPRIKKIHFLTTNIDRLFVYKEK